MELAASKDCKEKKLLFSFMSNNRSLAIKEQKREKKLKDKEKLRLLKDKESLSWR